MFPSCAGNHEGEPVVDTDQASGDESESGSSVTLDMTEYEWEALKAKLKGHGSATGGHGSATCGHGTATGGHDNKQKHTK